MRDKIREFGKRLRFDLDFRVPLAKVRQHFTAEQAQAMHKRLFAQWPEAAAYLERVKENKMMSEKGITKTCICGNTFVDEYEHRSFCGSTCAARAAGTVKVAERARDFLAGYILAHVEPDGTAGKVLKELLAALADVRKRSNG